MSFLVGSKDDILPFPWNRGPTSSNGSGSGLIVSEPEPKKLKATNEKQSLYATQWSPRLQLLAAECDGVGCIYLNLCRVNASAGAVLFHAIKVLTSLFKKEEPLIFKIGFTHDPVSRWTSPVYGYTLDLDPQQVDPYDCLVLFQRALWASYAGSCTYREVWQYL